jgi:large subunit ribosomal protein L18
MQKKMRSESEDRRWRRHKRVRNRVVGTTERPRVCVFRSNTHIYAQIIDDTSGRTLVSVSSLKLDAPAAAKPAAKSKKAKEGETTETPAGRKITLAREVGRLLAEAAKEKGVSKVAFDRGGYLYHGRVAALADSARKNGLEF